MLIKNKVSAALALLVVAALLGGLVLLKPELTRAAISAFRTDCYSAAATSTLAYMTPGTATTTTGCNLYIDGARTATANIVVNASSSLAVFNVYVEESMDGQDWFPVAPIQVGSTSVAFNAGLRAFTSFTFASSTIGQTGIGVGSNTLGVNGTHNRNHYTFDIPVRMKRVRILTTLTGANAGVWQQIVPRTDTN